MLLFKKKKKERPIHIILQVDKSYGVLLKRVQLMGILRTFVKEAFNVFFIPLYRLLFLTHTIYYTPTILFLHSPKKYCN
jgi:hypothetical protein